MTQVADYLKFYSDKGWRSFPVDRLKHPMIKDWPNQATCEINMLNGWLETFPNMNIGLATGKESGFFVLDVDKDKGGYDTLGNLIKNNSPLPKTPTANTGGGGKHYLFKYPDIEIRNVQNSLKMSGIDVRGQGGFIVVAPSIHETGNRYTWDKEAAPSVTPLADAPDWLLKILTNKSVPPVDTYQYVDSEVAIANGGRNNQLTSLAGTMRRKGMGNDAIYQALLIENKQKCIPPLADHEVKKIAESVTRYNPVVEFEQNRDRLQTEWSFCKAIFEYPNTSGDFPEVLPDMFQDHTLSEFWSYVQNNEDVTDSAVKAGILAELERYKDFDIARLDGYARQIQRFAHLAKIERLGSSLQRQAREYNDAGIEKVINDINKLPSQAATRIISIGDVAEEVEEEIRKRALNPMKVWGIHYAWQHLSEITGGKQKGELTLFPSEPKIGKSWWNLQDALFTAIGDARRGINEVPVFYWSGEMKRQQLMRRFYQLLGVNGRRMKEGTMQEEDWDKLTDAKATILNSPLYIDDKPLFLHEVRPMLVRQKAEHGVQQAIFDYGKLIQAPGVNEIEQTQNVSIEMKRLAQDLDLAITLIASVNKMGMDSKSEFATKSNVRGSGQQIHDADNVFIMTKFDEKAGMDYGLMPREYDNAKCLHLTAGRELEHNLEGGFLVFQQDGSPKFTEVRRIK